jgi:hypothetical protein
MSENSRIREAIESPLILFKEENLENICKYL